MTHFYTQPRRFSASTNGYAGFLRREDPAARRKVVFDKADWRVGVHVGQHFTYISPVPMLTIRLPRKESR